MKTPEQVKEMFQSAEPKTSWFSIAVDFIKFLFEETMNFLFECTPLGVLFILLVVVIGMLFGILKAIEWDNNKHDPIEYVAWKKAYPQSDLQYEDWRILKHAYLLPGQSAPPQSTTVVMPMPIYTR